MSKEELLANLREDIDLLTYDRQPTPEELKIVNDLSAIITIFNDQESLRDQIEYSISILKNVLKGV